MSFPISLPEGDTSVGISWSSRFNRFWEIPRSGAKNVRCVVRVYASCTRLRELDNSWDMLSLNSSNAWLKVWIFCVYLITSHYFARTRHTWPTSLGWFTAARRVLVLNLDIQEYQPPGIQSTGPTIVYLWVWKKCASETTIDHLHLVITRA